nr:2-oxoacid:acceptor oxidoreductase family protein [Candidatus Njordarchaeum guaymaensis]
MSGKIWEIRWHGRGGQGTVTAANLLARAALYNGFKGTQAFPFFGAERRGAPIKAFTRISKTPILVHSQVYNPDAVIILDSTIMKIINVLEGAKETAFLIMNSAKGEKELGLGGHFNTFVVDATGIALELGLIVAGQPIASTPMLGAFSRATKLVGMESIGRAILEEWRGGVGEKNVRAAEEAYKRVSPSLKERTAR